MLIEEIEQIFHYPHPDIHKGFYELHHQAFISLGARIDLTANVAIGEYCMIGEGAQIFTHDHIHEGREPLLIQNRIKWQNKVIGRDVWLHQCLVLYQVSNIPDGVVIGAGSVVTKNPEVPYGIYCGNPAVLIGHR